MAGRAQPSFAQDDLFPPSSNWQPPESLPDLSQETEVAIDTETKDDLLGKGKGPGFFRGTSSSGFVCGISVAWRQQAVYIPLHHNGRRNYFERDRIKRWIRSLAAQNHTRFIFHNFQYDWGWLQAEFGVEPPALLDDTMAMASMVNENLPEYSLEYLCQWQGLPGKDEALLHSIASLFKIQPKDIKKYMSEYKPEYVGPYAEQDALSTLNLAQKLRPLLAEEGLEEAYQIERDLLPITLKMKQHGVRINKIKTESIIAEIKKRTDDDIYLLSTKLKEKVEIKHIRSSRWLYRQFIDQGLGEPPRTAKSETHEQGQASFEKNFMANHDNWFPRLVHKIKHQTDMADKFLQTFIIDHAHKDRVHPTINQFRSEMGGARSHRFSYSNPALQQMPSRDDDWAPLIRSCFIPEDGEEWCSIDYRQQEYRLIVFVAEVMKCRGAHAAAQRYRHDPNTDFHDYVAQITRLPRRRAKDVNFAKAYGAGVSKFALMTGLDQEEAATVMEQYDRELPFVKEVAGRFTNLASNRGYIRLIDGARSHFNLMEPVYRDYNREWEARKKNSKIDTSPCIPEEYTRRKNDPDHPWYGERERRAFCHKAFNRMIQGSAARQTKKAMVDIVKAGFMPLLQMHDELAFSLKDRKHAYILSEIMQSAAPTVTIPMTTDIEFGQSWGELKK
jgi:DNA polymerase I-like protein with 3'-5' exonuclease and polymerase domains